MLQRRLFLSRGSAVGCVAALAGTGAVCAESASSEAPAHTVQPHRAPHDVGRKFRADGTVQPFAGNTFIGHVGQQGADFDMFDRLLDVYRDLPRQSFARKLSILPPSSYHVTVFVGLNEVDRGRPRWPGEFSPDTPMEAVTRIYAERMRALDATTTEPYDFVVDGKPALRSEGTLQIKLKPARAETKNRLDAVRGQLSRLTGLRDANHERYQYHLTLGYLHQFLTPEESAEMLQASENWARNVSELGQPLLIRKLQFCAFRDMFAFRVVHQA
ncbi:DUF1868 domain-containing protein [Variovorax sp. AFSI2.2]|uniref:DUF1868 domain-containing protein n=1 Tax=Variovorax sp. AFSI2.2 TaxID=3384160 RepID=UPI003EBFE274